MDTIQDRVQQLEFRALAHVSSLEPEARSQKAKSSIEQDTDLHWEVASSEFQRRTGHARMRDVSVDNLTACCPWTSVPFRSVTTGH
ncbi:hypothetical protein BDV24DRAFT_133575 [Aspergillus arachidicola]|uniref:Uncharacterized protein n=1 Tax=Aspergillus arachidicola TaxID=656916 RepID=A0A5N6Y5C2_9EURO|nr:hypothetical protein BDV24DRAFT_133575 [Aspergillus arachidicola]